MTSQKSAVPNGLPALALGTTSFAICFAAWGLIAAFAPRFREAFHLSATQAALMIAVPVLLGSLARLPVGMLADRFGGRLVFSLLMLLSAAPSFLTPMAETYPQLLIGSFFLGLGALRSPPVSGLSRAGSVRKSKSARRVYTD